MGWAAAVVQPLDGTSGDASQWAGLPAVAGVAQLLGRDGRPLVTARAPNLRRFVASKLAPPKPPAAGRRPALDLRPLVAGLRHVVSTSPFHQRLVFERLMADEVPLHKRRDLKPPLYLRLDCAQRFPRVEAVAGGAGPLYGPLRDRRAAERAGKALHKLFPLRPCDFTFEPDPGSTLGLGCLYAQVRSCAAPCLARVSEDDYRALARRAAALLDAPQARAEDTREWLPGYVTRADGQALVIERVKDVFEVYPVRDGALLDERALRGDAATIQTAASAWAAALPASAPAGAPDDRRWLAAHFFARPRSTTYVAATDDDAPALAARLRALLRAG